MAGGKLLLVPPKSSWVGICGQRFHPWWSCRHPPDVSRGGNPPGFKHRDEFPSPTAPKLWNVLGSFLFGDAFGVPFLREQGASSGAHPDKSR